MLQCRNSDTMLIIYHYIFCICLKKNKEKLSILTVKTHYESFIILQIDNLNFQLVAFISSLNFLKKPKYFQYFPVFSIFTPIKLMKLLLSKEKKKSSHTNTLIYFSIHIIVSNLSRNYFLIDLYRLVGKKRWITSCHFIY